MSETRTPSGENEADEAGILADQDDTHNANMGAEGTDKLAADEPGDFVRGEVDVKTQMDRASREITNGSSLRESEA